jgi:hypothetical protein
MEMNNHQFLFLDSFLQSNGMVSANLFGECAQAGTVDAGALRFTKGLLGGLLAGATIISTTADVMLSNRLALIKHANVGAVRQRRVRSIGVIRDALTKSPRG